MTAHRRGLQLFTRENPVIGKQRLRGKPPDLDDAALEALPEFYASGGVASFPLFLDPDGTADRCLSLSCVKLASHYIIPHHSHTGDCLYYVAAGEIHLGNRVVHAGAGFFVPDGAPYGYSAGPDGAEVLEFRGTLLAVNSELLEKDWGGILATVRANRERWSDEMAPYAKWVDDGSRHPELREQGSTVPGGVK